MTDLKSHGNCPRCQGPVCPEGWACGPVNDPVCYCIRCAAELLKTSIETLREHLADPKGINVCAGHIHGSGPCPLLLNRVP